MKKEEDKTFRKKKDRKKKEGRKKGRILLFALCIAVSTERLNF